MSALRDAGRRDGLAARWAAFADHEAASYSPLYAAIARSVVDDDDLLALTAAAPRPGQRPIMMLAAVHFLLLGGDDHPLGDVYARRLPPAGAPAQFRDFCLTRRDEIIAVVAARRLQTNECGRSALIALGLNAVAQHVGQPQVLLDAGASAGLNLLYDRYHLDYGPAGSLGDTSSAVHIQCALKGHGQLPRSLQDVPVRLGLDREPVDVGDADDARWLLACTWPDTGRMPRTAAAIDLARRHRPVVRTGDMATDVPAVLDGTGDGLAVVVTSWAFAYLSADQRTGFIDSLGVAAMRRPVVWLAFEGPGVVDLYEQPMPTDDTDVVPSVVGMAAFGAAGGDARPLALVHPHGAWLHWLAPM